MDTYRFFQSVASKLGAGTLEVVLVFLISADYFKYITINEPIHKYIISLLFLQTLGIPFLGKTKVAKRVEKGVCPHCGISYSITGYKCETCGYTVPNRNEKG